jgi:hypothetical protein
MASFIVVRRKLKSSGVSVVCILVTVAFDFFWEGDFGGDPFHFFITLTSSFCLCSTSSRYSPLPPLYGVTEAILIDMLSTS